jgi:threonine dehydratase
LDLRLDPPREVLLKREDTGPNGAFKWRGAMCACAAFKSSGAAAVVTSSTGNHGAATGWAAQRAGLQAHVVVPVDSALSKRRLIERSGAALHEFGVDLEEAAEHAHELADALGVPLLIDGGCEAQLYGTGTIGAELRAVDFDTVVVPLACGALAGGLARELATVRPKPWVVGVQSSMYGRLGALLRGEPDPLMPSGHSFADGLADNRIVEPAFSTCRSYLDDVVSVDDEALRSAMRELWTFRGMVVEGAAAAPLAALRQHPDRIPGHRVVLIISGRNIDDRLRNEVLGDLDPDRNPTRPPTQDPAVRARI